MELYFHCSESEIRAAGARANAVYRSGEEPRFYFRRYSRARLPPHLADHPLVSGQDVHWICQVAPPSWTPEDQVAYHQTSCMFGQLMADIGGSRIELVEEIPGTPLGTPPAVPTPPITRPSTPAATTPSAEPDGARSRSHHDPGPSSPRAGVLTPQSLTRLFHSSLLRERIDGFETEEEVMCWIDGEPGGAASDDQLEDFSYVLGLIESADVSAPPAAAPDALTVGNPPMAFADLSPAQQVIYTYMHIYASPHLAHPYINCLCPCLLTHLLTRRHYSTPSLLSLQAWTPSLSSGMRLSIS